MSDARDAVDDDHYVVCPHCGYKHGDAWEYKTGDHNCAECDREFRLYVDVRVTYRTSKAEGDHAA